MKLVRTLQTIAFEYTQFEMAESAAAANVVGMLDAWREKEKEKSETKEQLFE